MGRVDEETGKQSTATETRNGGGDVDTEVDTSEGDMKSKATCGSLFKSFSECADRVLIALLHEETETEAGRRHLDTEVDTLTRRWTRRNGTS